VNVLDSIRDFFGPQSRPETIAVVGPLALALVLVVFRDVWRVARHAITIAHEGGHALLALLSGRRLQGIKLHSDTSGVTLSKGRPHGLGMVMTVLAGYPTPPLVGLVGAVLLTMGRASLMLWLTLVLLAAVLLLIRNFYGLLSVLVTGAVVFVVTWYAPDWVQVAFAYAGVWFLLIGGVRPVFELQRQRRRGRAPDSDADQLAGVTVLPAFGWVVLFFLIATGSLAVGGYLLVRPLLGD
jgi:Peptidase M50B-like